MSCDRLTDDFALLRRYQSDRDQAAFTAVVQRYVPLVYSAAARRVGDRHLAQDITQAVFLILSRKTASIHSHRPLSNWLLTTTRYAAANALKIESRRRRHEEAAAMNPMNPSAVSGVCSADPSEALVWQEIAAHLDDAVLKLHALDRQAVLLRYFEDRPIHDIAVALNCSEGAVKQRLHRAIEKLRVRLDRSTSGAVGAVSAVHLAALLSSHVLQPSPTGLAASTSAALFQAASATATSTAAASSTLTTHIAKGAMHMMTWTKAKIAASIIVAVTLGGTTGIVTINHALAQADPPAPARANSGPAKARPAAGKPDKKDNYLGIVTIEDAPPVVIETFPKSGAADVDASATTELKVTFSKDMQDGNWSWAQISKLTFPQTTGKPHYLDDHRTCVLPVKLEPNHTYVIQLNYPPFNAFSDPTGRKAVQYLLVFQTKP